MEVVEGSLARPRPEWPEAPAAAARLLAADTTLLRVCCSREPGLAGAGPGAGQRLQYNMLSRLSGYTVHSRHSTSASWPSRGWPGCRVCGCVRASRASWTAATRGRGRTCPGSWGHCRRAAEVARVSRGRGCTGDSHLGCGQVVLALKQIGGASPPVCAGVSPGLLEF